MTPVYHKISVVEYILFKSLLPQSHPNLYVTCLLLTNENLQTTFDGLIIAPLTVNMPLLDCKSSVRNNNNNNNNNSHFLFFLKSSSHQISTFLRFLHPLVPGHILPLIPRYLHSIFVVVCLFGVPLGCTPVPVGISALSYTPQPYTISRPSIWSVIVASYGLSN